MIRRYGELIQRSDFIDRFNYLKLDSIVGRETFGYDRYLNQKFYKSKEWKDLRNYVIVRDNGCDLACDGYEIHGKIIIHHMNPITADHIIHGDNEALLNPDFLVCVSLDTHNAIHYGDSTLLVSDPVVRKRNDTCPWKVI